MVDVLVKNKEVKMVYSASSSFEGFNLIELVKGQWPAIKEVVKVGAPFLFGLSFFKENPVMIGVITILGKGLLDSIHYWLKEHK